MMSTSRRLFWWVRSHSVVERQSKGLRKVSSTIGGGDTARFATEHACRGMRRGARADGTRPSADDRSTGSWADSGGAGAAVSPDSTGQCSKSSETGAQGLPLNPDMVKGARELFMQYMDELKVLEDSDRGTCMTETGRPPIPTDWVDIDKGDSIRPNYRSRLVCQETRGRSTIDVEDLAATFAATPRTRHSDCS